MIRVSNLCKSYGPQLLFDNVTFSMQPGERLGLVGRNGHGKSTLFRILIGEEQADSGEIFVPRGYKIGHLSQHLVFHEPTILAEVSQALPEYEGGWREEYKAEEMLAGLGFSRSDFARAPSEFSGGFQIRLNLAKLLLAAPNLLLLDEPTNYLDIVAVRWIVRFLKEWEGEMMLITHDRDFMDSVTSHTMAIHRQKAKKLEGPTGKLYAQILQEEEIYDQTRLNEEKRRKEIESFVDRFRAKASKARQVQSRVKMLEKMGTKEELGDIQTLDFRFRAAPFPGKFICQISDLAFGYDPKDLLIKKLSLSIGKRDRIAVIGPNGRGKTTFLSLLAEELKPTAGAVTYSSNSVVGYFGQTNINRLNLSHTIESELMSAHPEHSRGVARSIAGLMLFEGDSALKGIRYLSGGERSRVLLGKILLTPSNCLLLDEPTNHLDMESVEALLDAVDEFDGAVVIVTHSEEILHRMATRLVVFDRGEVVLFEGTYQDFLDRVGWASEGDDEDAVPSASRSAVPVEDVKELKKRMQYCEREVIQLEKDAKKLEDEMRAASESQNVAKITSSSTAFHENQRRIEELFKEMEGLERRIGSAQ